MGYGPGTNRFDFRTDPDPDLDTGNIFLFSNTEVDFGEIGYFLTSSNITALKKFWTNFLEMFRREMKQSTIFWD